jgi:hypothetical protein
MLALLACTEPAPPPSGEAAYVWQSAWTPAVRAAVDDARADGLRLYVLHAEIGTATRTIAVPDIGPHAAVVRVHDLARRDDARELLLALAGRPDVTEVQLDADVPTAGLQGYAEWLATVDVPVPLSITGLPDWLGSRALPDVLAQVDAWTIQLHAPARRYEDAVSLDVDLARVTTLGAPFRVALPTYGVGLVLDREGVGTGVVGEGVRFDGPEVWAAPAEVAAIVRDLPSEPGFLGVTWFRLPVDGDRWTWSRPTWNAVRAGRAPEGRLVVEQDGVDLRVHNLGDGDTPALPIQLSGDVSAFDAVGGWRAQEVGGGVRFEPPLRPIPAGASRPVGWARGVYTAQLVTP